MLHPSAARSPTILGIPRAVVRILAIVVPALCEACAHRPNGGDLATVATQASPATSAESSAAALVADLEHRDWAAAEARLAPPVAYALPEARLADLWEQLLAKQGEFVRIEQYATERAASLTVAVLDLRFARRRQWLRVTVGSGDKIVGIFHGPQREDIEQEAHALVEALARGDGERATHAFDATMRTKLSATKVVEDWNGVVARAGTFDGIGGVKIEGLVARVDVRTKGPGIVVRVAFNPDGDVAGLFFRLGYEPPNYVDMSAIAEREVQVGSAPPLPGTLTLPRHARAVAGIVLVHGSGPNDRDETVGGTLVFRDLALGLATRGFAVLRYEKRTRIDRAGVVTQKEEVLDGALAAVDLLRKQPEVDPSLIVVVGHSQGGALAPRIAQADGRLAGIVVLAGPTRSLQDSTVAQATYLSSLDPNDASRREALEKALAFKRAVEDPALKPESELPGGGAWRGAYFLAMRGYHPEQMAAKLSCAVLVVQGGRDYQVTLAEDFAGWRRALAENHRATLKTYRELDHRLVAGEGASTPDQYAHAEHVDARLVMDVATWISTLGPAPAGPGGM